MYKENYDYNKSYAEEEYGKSFADDMRRKTLIDFCTELVSKSGNNLDIGCGVGQTLVSLGKRKDGFFFGTDISIAALLEAKAKNPELLLIAADTENLPLRANSIDLVVCAEHLEHLERPDIALKHINEVLRDDGLVVVTAPKLDIPFLRPFITKVYRTFLGRAEDIEKRHIWVFSTKQVRALLREQGFDIEKEMHVCSPIGSITLRHALPLSLRKAAFFLDQAFSTLFARIKFANFLFSGVYITARRKGGVLKFVNDSKEL